MANVFGKHRSRWASRVSQNGTLLSGQMGLSAWVEVNYLAFESNGANVPFRDSDESAIVWTRLHGMA